ncbi:kinase-like domain-containing protein [Xylariaceae sp. FL0255]|nr:kinase-like domain-containing protein [Xylariaceae sp. FL0255]
MAPAVDPARVAAIMLSWQSLELVSLRKIQSLWAGYGHICEIKARAANSEVAAHLSGLYKDASVVDKRKGETTFAFILKLIPPPRVRPGSEDEGHLRKILSYEVEQEFYASIAPQLGRELPVAQVIATTHEMDGKPSADILEGLTATMMTDLRIRYPVAGEKRAALNERQVYSALDWLSGFHRTSWDMEPIPAGKLVLPPLQEAERRQSGTSYERSVWLNGGYTYLATRRKEYESLCADADSEWASSLCRPVSQGHPLAEMVADFLKTSGRLKYETLIHGDVKSENLFTTQDGSEVVFYDFQYVGFGLGVCDLAKLFTCSVPLHMLVDDDSPSRLEMGEGEKRLLEYYRKNLLAKTEKTYDWDTFVRHWETALVDWLRFQASWGFWGNTEWLEGRVRSIVSDQAWRKWLIEQQTSQLN